MTADQSAPAPALTGAMYLYAKPTLLTHEEHGQLGLTSTAGRFGFAASARVIPLTIGEFGAAQRDYPVVFSEEETPVPLAVVGTHEDRNLFVGADGRWAAGRYVPSYLRRYPLALAKQDDRYAVVFDANSDLVSEEPDLPFFEGESLSAGVQPMVDFCRQVEEDRQRTARFVQRLQELDLLSRQGSSYTMPGASEPTPIASYLAIDTAKLGRLDDAAVVSLYREGYLAAAMAHTFSLANWQRLIERYQAVQAGQDV